MKEFCSRLFLFVNLAKSWLLTITFYIVFVFSLASLIIWKVLFQSDFRKNVCKKSSKLRCGPHKGHWYNQAAGPVQAEEGRRAYLLATRSVIPGTRLKTEFLKNCWIKCLHNSVHQNDTDVTVLVCWLLTSDSAEDLEVSRGPHWLRWQHWAEPQTHRGWWRMTAVWSSPPLVDRSIWLQLCPHIWDGDRGRNNTESQQTDW